MGMRFTLSVLGFGLGLGLLASGCALTPSDVHPPASPPITTATQGNAREVLVVGPFVDERENTETCGTKTNGYGMNTSHIRCATPPGTWLADSIEDGFRKNGYTILPRNATPHADTILVLGSVKELYMSPDTTVHHTMNQLRVRANVDVRIPHAGDEEREFTVVGTSPMTAENNQGYDNAAYSATVQIVADVVEAVGELAQHPDMAEASHWHTPIDEKVKPMLATLPAPGAASL